MLKSVVSLRSQGTDPASVASFPTNPENPDSCSPLHQVKCYSVNPLPRPRCLPLLKSFLSGNPLPQHDTTISHCSAGWIQPDTSWLLPGSQALPVYSQTLLRMSHHSSSAVRDGTVHGLSSLGPWTSHPASPF